MFASIQYEFNDICENRKCFDNLHFTKINYRQLSKSIYIFIGWFVFKTDQTFIYNLPGFDQAFKVIFDF